MWFKQCQIFRLTDFLPFSAPKLAEKLQPLAFNSCLPSMPSSLGWVSPIEIENEPLVRGLNGCMMICLQLEEKILPVSVVMQAVKDKMKQIENKEGRRVRQKEKMTMKDEMTQTLMPRAFTKLTRIYAYIDTRHQWLILNCISPKKSELFISFLKKTLGDGIKSLDVMKPSSIITSWLKNKESPQVFSIDKSCVLQDPNQQKRMVRCQQQDLFSESIQSLLKEGFAAIQTGLCWHDKLDFVIAEDFTLRTIRMSEDDLAEIQDEMETKQQKFDADFIMLTEMFAGLLTDLLKIFDKNSEEKLAKVG